MKVAFLSPELASEVRKLVRRDRLRGHTQIQNHRKKRIPRGDAGTRIRYGQTNEVITARSGATLGSGEISIYTNASGTLTDTAEDIDVYNPWNVRFESGVWVEYGQDSDGEWTLLGNVMQAYVGLTDGTITARSGTTLGSGTVSLYTNSGTSLSDTGANVTAYNFGANSIAISTYVQVEQFAPNGDWFITAVDCGV